MSGDLWPSEPVLEFLGNIHGAWESYTPTRPGTGSSNGGDMDYNPVTIYLDVNGVLNSADPTASGWRTSKTHTFDIRLGSDLDVDAER